MMSHVYRVIKKGLISKGSIPKHFPDSIQYETIMGSIAYGVDSDASDMDVYGFCIPGKHIIFPHLNGYINGFGAQPEKFEQWQMHHIIDPDLNREYDFTIYNIVKYFSLVMENNPNMIDSLFTHQNSVLHCSPIAQLVRDNRKIFLHKGCWHKFKGYAYAQLHKIRSKESPEGKRKELIEEFGFDVKFAYHTVRLIDEVEQILVEGDLDLQRNREKLKAIRRGEWKLDDVLTYFQEREVHLEKAYLESSLPHSPNEAAIKQLLIDCLEHHYGSLQDSIVNVDAATTTLQKVAEIIKQAGY